MIPLSIIPLAWWNLPTQLVLLVLLIALSAFFSGAEIALIGLSSFRRKHDAEKGDRRADLVDRLMQRPARVLITILIGNNVVNISASVLAGYIAAKEFNSWGPGIAIAAMTLLVLTFGEILPKALATGRTVGYARFVARPIWLLQMLLLPIVLFFEGLTHLMYKILNIPEERRLLLSKGELRTIVQVGTDEGVIEKEEEEMISHVIAFSDTRVKEIMVPRTDMTCLDVRASIDAAADLFLTKGFSRIPVYREHRDQIVGVLFAKDLLAHLAADRRNTGEREEGVDLGEVEAIMKPPHFMPESRYLNEAFPDLREKRIHLAIVVDEFGGTAGLVTMEDIIEEIVGEIFDEFDTQARKMVWIDGHSAFIDARIPIDDLNAELGLQISEDEEFETLGGFLLHQLGRPGKQGERVEWEDFNFTIERISGQRILWVRAQRRAKDS